MSALSDYLKSNAGKFPPVELRATPLSKEPALTVAEFLSYRFDSNVMVAADSFDFTFSAPGTTDSLADIFREGDIIDLGAYGQQLSRGIIDHVDIETDLESGDRVALSGRDLFGQFEDNSTILLSGTPIAGMYNSKEVGQLLARDTRIAPDIELRDAPTQRWPFSTEPGETKLSALQRYLEPLNCLAWMSPAGKMIIGRPNMTQANKQGELYMLKGRRDSNCLSMKVGRASTQIPNIVFPIFIAQNESTDKAIPGTKILNAAQGPSRLLRLNHRVAKTVVISDPSGSTAEKFADVNRLTAAGSNLLAGYAEREFARANFRELQVQCIRPGHYNESGNPYRIDQCYHVRYDRGGVDELMYLYRVEYTLDKKNGPQTRLSLCRLGTIVSRIKVK